MRGVFSFQADDSGVGCEVSDSIDLRDRVERAGEAARRQLLEERNAGGWWEGQLSSSALSTAVAVLALGEFERTAKTAGNSSRSVSGHAGISPQNGPGDDNRADSGRIVRLIANGLRWLAATQLENGGWGDTIKSKANVATTLLVWAALGSGVGILGNLRKEDLAAGHRIRPPRSSGGDFRSELEGVTARAEEWIRREAGGLEVAKLKAALAKRYGKDKTFAVPILMACAVGGRLGPAPGCWREVPSLPFELAAFPRRWFAALRLPVVSYALPALIAIGQVRHFHAPVWGPWAWVRRAVAARTRLLLREIQPQGGGFLEATPLTGFVTMALCSAGEGDGAVVREAVDFLHRSVREDGSWPIDSNLATWGTSLSVKALGGDLPKQDREPVLRWLLGQQYRVKHPYCLSAPGGWAWTDLPGGVPDADDTAGALLALRELNEMAAAGDGQVGKVPVHLREAAEAGAQWLAALQNNDGGMPTFCKGWGALPFDRSAPDLTAHALAAWQAWREDLVTDIRPSMRRAVAWLKKTQRKDGAWVPLWFGNEHEPDEGNPVYGTAVVLKYLGRLSAREFPALTAVRRKAAAYLTGVQLEDGTWGGGAGAGPGSIEETGAALEGLVAYAGRTTWTTAETTLKDKKAVERGASALLRLTGEGQNFPPAPIGLYFARLWYYEKLYPQVAAVAALRALRGFPPEQRG